MPLTACPDCGTQISSEARSCPKCGRPAGGGRAAATPTSGGFIGRVFKVGGAVLLGLYLMGRCSGSSTGGGEVEACVARGVAYFSSIQSMPTLSDGRDARTVARERCNRTTTAF